MTREMPTDLVIVGNSLSVRKIGPWLSEVLEALPTEERKAMVSGLELAVHEVAMNIIDHAQLPPSAVIRFSADITAVAVEVTVSDPGESFEPEDERVPIAGVPQERGYGLLLVRKLVDHLGYCRVDGGNRWTLRVNRTRPTGHRTGEAGRQHD